METKNIVAVLVALGIVAEANESKAIRVLEAMAEPDDADVKIAVAKVLSKHPKTGMASGTRTIENRKAYWPTKAGLKMDINAVHGVSKRPVFAVIRKQVGMSKRAIMAAAGLEQGQTENAIYELQVAGLVEAREL